MVNEVMKKVVITKKDSLGLRFLYHTFIGRIILSILVRPTTSKIVGHFMNSRFSTIFIKSFIKKNNIDINEYEEKKYRSYNDFFTRKVKEGKRVVDSDATSLVAPSDAKLTAYKINKNSIFFIKGTPYSISHLLQNDELAKEYEEGYCLIFRLSVDDYHHYCYIDEGFHEKSTHIKGVLHTVRPIAFEKYDVYKENSREYTILNTKNFGKVIQVEVGAMLIGQITNLHQAHQFVKGEEKGMFEFGGSTIVLLFTKDRVKINKTILKNTSDNYETIVKMGEKVGVKSSFR